MLLLLLLGAGVTTPTVDGVRAYGHTTYATVTQSATATMTITNAARTVRAVTNAETTEE